MEINPPATPPSILDQISHLVENFPQRPSWDEYFMATALLIASRSSCSRLNVGCVLAQNNRIIAAGYNGYLPGAPHIPRIRDGHEQGTVHAEQNAISDAARRGVQVQGSVAYITHFPCINCTKILVAAGVSGINYHFDYNNDPYTFELLEEAGTTLRQL
jgi:dCMP deaminase